VFLAVIFVGLGGLAANAAVRLIRIRRTARRFRDGMHKYMTENNYPSDSE
jgi:hypothetical protein